MVYLSTVHRLEEPMTWKRICSMFCIQDFETQIRKRYLKFAQRKIYASKTLAAKVSGWPAYRDKKPAACIEPKRLNL